VLVTGNSQGGTLMKRTAITLAFSVAILVLIPIGARAQENDGCSIATLNGSFGIQVTGSIVAFGPVGPVAEVGIINFDGAGGASQTTTVSLNGTIVPNRSSLSGSYQVNPDCTGDLTLVLPVSLGVTTTSTSHFVIVEHGKEIRLVNTGAGRVLAGNARRIQK
jgi:hypothetical protein